MGTLEGRRPSESLCCNGQVREVPSSGRLHPDWEPQSGSDRPSCVSLLTWASPVLSSADREGLSTRTPAPFTVPGTLSTQFHVLKEGRKGDQPWGLWGTMRQGEGQDGSRGPPLEERVEGTQFKVFSECLSRVVPFSTS